MRGLRGGDGGRREPSKVPIEKPPSKELVPIEKPPRRELARRPADHAPASQGETVGAVKQALETLKDLGERLIEKLGRHKKADDQQVKYLGIEDGRPVYQGPIDKIERLLLPKGATAYGFHSDQWYWREDGKVAQKRSIMYNGIYQSKDGGYGVFQGSVDYIRVVAPDALRNEND